MTEAAAPETNVTVEAPVDTLAGEPSEEQMDSALGAQGPFGDKRLELENESDSERVPADVVRNLIGKVEEGARVALGGKPEEPKGGKPALVSDGGDKKPEPTETEKLRAELAKAQESTQKRIDELTAKLHEAEARKTTDGKPAPKTIQELPEDDLDKMLLHARRGGYGAVKDEATGDVVPGDPTQNLKIEKQVLAEIMRRRSDAQEQPARNAAKLQRAHGESAEKALKDFHKYLHSSKQGPDGKAVEAFDPNLPVAKLAQERLADWEKNDPDSYRHPDAPRRAVKEALAELSAKADVTMARELHRLQLENQDLRGRTGIDGGKPGGSATARKPAGEDMSDAKYDETRRALFAGATGS